MQTLILELENKLCFESELDLSLFYKKKWKFFDNFPLISTGKEDYRCSYSQKCNFF